MNERFQARKDAIKLLGHRAGEAKIDTIRSHAEAVPLLLPHTAYKSYPESWLMDERWDRLGKWMDTVSSHRVPAQDRSKVRDMDDWIEPQIGRASGRERVGQYVSNPGVGGRLKKKKKKAER